MAKADRQTGYRSRRLPCAQVGRRGRWLSAFLNWEGSAMWLLRSFLASFLLVVGSAVWADCACFCVDGAPKTLCTAVSEAQAEPNECPALSPNSCPADPDNVSGAVHDAPEEGATNCRDVRVWDAAKNRFSNVKACDVLSAS